MEAKFRDSLLSPKIAGFEWQEPDGEGGRNIYRDILTEGCTIDAKAREIQTLVAQPES